MKDSEIRAQLLRTGNLKPNIIHRTGKTERRKQLQKQRKQPRIPTAEDDAAMQKGKKS